MPRRPINPQSAPHEVSVGDPSAIERNLSRLDRRIRELEDRSREAGVAGGRLLGRFRLTGSGVYTPTAGTTRVHVRMQGGGGGGAGTSTGANSAGGGGSSGVLLEFVRGDDSTLIVGGAYSCGGGGGGGSSDPEIGLNGRNGNDTNIRLGTELITARGGQGGRSQPPGTSSYAAGGGRVDGSTTIDISVASQSMGLPGINVSGYFYSGAGGYSPLGIPGSPIDGSDDGIDAVGFGAGGGGAASSSSAHDGGDGAPGVILIDEFGS